MLAFLLTLCEDDEQREKISFLYNEYCNVMLGRAYCVLHDRSLSEEAVQEAFVRLIVSKFVIEDVTNPRVLNLLFVIVTNTSRDLYRKRRFREQTEHELGQYESFVAPDDGIETQTDYHDLLGVIDNLSEQSRDALYLTGVLGCNSRETAKLLGISESTARKRAERARKELEKSL